MNNHKRIGRKVLLKYYLIFTLLLLIIPLLIELFYHNHPDVLTALKATYKFKRVETTGVLFVFLQIAVISIGIWFFGARATKAILEEEKPTFRTGFFAIFKLWVLYFMSAALLTVVSNYNTDFPQFLINSIIWIFYMSMLLGILHGVMLGYFVGKEIKKIRNR